MWIHHIGEIMIGVTVALLAAHFGAHFYFKRKRRRREATRPRRDAS